MGNIDSLLGIDEEAIYGFALQARELQKNHELDRIIKRSTNRLKEIQNRMASDGKRPDFKKQDVDAVIAKVSKSTKGTNVALDIKELRILSYNLNLLLKTEAEFSHAVNLIDNDWRDLFIGGLMFFVMNSWNNSSEYNKEKVCGLLTSRLRNYSGGIRKYRTLKEHTDLLEPTGPRRLAALLQAKGLVLLDAPTILGYRQSAFSFPYFSDMILRYVKKNNVGIDQIEYVFNHHSLDRTKKLIYSYLIEKAEEKNDTVFQDAVTRSARRVLGDINQATTWSPFTGATPEEEEQLQKASKLVKAWGARKTIEAFFDSVQDPRRRKCWLEYIGYVMDYRIVGSTTVKHKLRANSEVAPLLNACFLETNSTVATTAALVLYIKDKVFVEFSDVGSLYIYNNTNGVIKNLKKLRSIDSTGDLKLPGIGNVMEKLSSWSYLCYDEGRLMHRGEWEARFRYWMRDKLGLMPGQKAKAAPKPNYFSFDEYHTTRTSPSQRPQNVNQKQEIVTEFTKSNQGTTSHNGSTKEQSSNSNPYTPGSVVHINIDGPKSKWVFQRTYRIIIDLTGIYIYSNKDSKTYFAASHSPRISSQLFSNVGKVSIWLISQNNTDTSFGVFLAIPNGKTGNTTQEKIGTFEKKGNTVIYTPSEGPAARIYNY